MPRKPAPPPKKASGANVEDWQRHTARMTLRLPPEIDEQLRARASQEGMTLVAYVTRLIRQDLAIV